MKPVIIAVLLLGLFAADAEAQLFRRSTGYCNCYMCRVRRGEVPGYAWVNGRAVQVRRPVQRAAPVRRAESPAQKAAPAADTTLVPSSPEVVQAVMDLANIREGDVFADLGCGDGRFLPAAIKRGAHFAIGIEIDPDTAALARRNTAEIPGVFIVEADVRQVSLARYDVMTMYLFEESMPSLETMKPGAVILSISHPIRDIPAQRVLIEADGKQHPVYVYRKPLEVP
jgi:SAM-dependent methyltransferase